MKCYLLLRNNRETGPFSLEEITEQSLQPSDLIWIEGQSVAWNYPAEIEALKPFVSVDDFLVKSEPQNGRFSTSSNRIFVALPSPLHTPYISEEDRDKKESIELETRFSQPLEKLKEKYNPPDKQPTFSFPKTFSKPHTGLWIGCVFAGLLLSAGIIKKIADAYEENKTGWATAASLPVQDMDDIKSLPEASLYQNALTTEVVPIDTATRKEVKKAPAKVNLKKLVRLEANDYQVGLFGGIKNLRLLVTNKSGFILDKVKIELQYLKPNGAVLKTEKLTMKSVAPRSRQSLNVSSENRGVKIAYKITNIQSKQNEAALINL